MSNSSGQALKFDALKSLYDAQLGALKILSERSFSTTLQTLTLNIAVVAGLIGGKVSLSPDGKLIGTSLLLVFNALVATYLVSKSLAHNRERQKLIGVQSCIADIAEVGAQFANNHPSFLRSFFGGSGIFILSVALACACSISALWVPLLSQEAMK